MPLNDSGKPGGCSNVVRTASSEYHYNFGQSSGNSVLRRYHFDKSIYICLSFRTLVCFYLLLYVSNTTAFLQLPLTFHARPIRMNNVPVTMISPQLSNDTSMVQNLIPRKNVIIKTEPFREVTDTHKSENKETTTKLDLKLILLDNYDSYTYNIYSYLSTICKEPPLVLTNDAFASWTELNNTIVERFDGIIISPGPGAPQRDQDIGICLEAIAQNPELPILGVCLGHQALGHYYNASVGLAPCGPIHGLISEVRYSNDDFVRSFKEGEIRDSDTMNDAYKYNLFEGVPQNFEVVRYHSLAVTFPNSAETNDLDIEPIAWCWGNPLDSNGEGALKGEQNEVNSSDLICMALRHKRFPHYGVQFHPESIGTGEDGYKIFENFCKICYDLKVTNVQLDGSSIDRKPEEKGETNPGVRVSPWKNEQSMNESQLKYEVFVHKISSASSTLPLPEQVHREIFTSMNDTFWLDSSTGRKNADLDMGKDGSCPIVSNSRFSFMGGNDGPLGKKVVYYGKEHSPENRGIYVSGGDLKEPVMKSEVDIISYLRQEMSQCGTIHSAQRVEFYSTDEGEEKMSLKEASSAELPFEYRGGFVGYLGYEVRHDTRSSFCDQEICKEECNREPVEYNGPDHHVPSAEFLFADRSLVYDHWRGEWYAVGVAKTSKSIGELKNGQPPQVIQWIKGISMKLKSMKNPIKDVPLVRDIESTVKKPVPFSLERSKSEYSKDICRCHDEIKNGESYELCLTNKLLTEVNVSPENPPLNLYEILREKNPAPFSAFLSFDNTLTKRDLLDQAQIRQSSISICCSSPERFLSISKAKIVPPFSTGTAEEHGWEFKPPFVSQQEKETQFVVESKPIKGTSPRSTEQDDINRTKDDARIAEDLRLCTKNRAENLMIVDLLRNDLSRVCEPGSVHVPRLMQIESFATVHQLVSTITGIVSPQNNAVDVLSSSFPGGSMTGAPKLRTTDILNEMELGRSRGPYSGCLGYISLNGVMDMNIIIRTAVVTPVDEKCEDGDEKWNVSIGAGGAVTALSDSEDEFEEMLLKARVIKEAVNEWNRLNI